MIARHIAAGGTMKSVCELGCANGWRLAELASAYPPLERLAGADISEAAIGDGRAKWPTLELRVGAIEEHVIGGLFDVVIVNYVLCWVDRSKLIRATFEIDSRIKPGGVLVLADFLPSQPVANPYHHRTDVELRTYKQDYSRNFVAHGYEVLDSTIFSHDGAAGEPEENNRAGCFLLRKPE